MQASLPFDKLNCIREAMKDGLEHETLTKTLLSLLGHLNFMMQIILQSRSFISRLTDISKTINRLRDSIKLDLCCKSELRFWSLLCEGWNGMSFFTMMRLTSVALKFNFFY